MTTSVQPTQSRLMLALAPATLIVALMLQTLAIVLYQHAPSLDRFGLPSRPLSVHVSLRESTPETVPDTEQPEASISDWGILDPEHTRDFSVSSRAEAAPVESQTEAIETQSDAEPQQPGTRVDWRRLAESTSSEYMEQVHAQEALRAERWRASGSILFAPREDMPVAVESELLPDYRFLEPDGVLGLGLTIGQCFVGLPLIGIPVAERSPAITLIYCRR